MNNHPVVIMQVVVHIARTGITININSLKWLLSCGLGQIAKGLYKRQRKSEQKKHKGMYLGCRLGFPPAGGQAKGKTRERKRGTVREFLCVLLKITLVLMNQNS